MLEHFSKHLDSIDTKVEKKKKLSEYALGITKNED